MKTAGIIGGIGPESTIEYYRLTIASYRKQNPGGGYPSILINSVNMSKMLDLIQTDRWSEMTAYLLEEIQRLKQAGADFGALAANTPHIIFDDLSRQSPIPLISIVESACQAATSRGLKRVGLFGTRFTMQGRFYPDVFTRAGIVIVTPSTEEQTYIHDKYLNELAYGVLLPETRQGLLAIAETFRSRDGIEGLILGGTELPLILKEEDGSVPFLDTTKIHVERIVSELLK